MNGQVGKNRIGSPAGNRPQHFGQPEVEQLNLTFGCDEYIGRFDVAVNDSFGMGRRQGPGYLNAQIPVVLQFPGDPGPSVA